MILKRLVNLLLKRATKHLIDFQIHGSETIRVLTAKMYAIKVFERNQKHSK